MTKSDFLAEPPIEFTIHGRAIRLVPRIQPGGLAVFESERLDLIIPTVGGNIRFNGTIRLTSPRSKHWSEQP